MKTEMVSRTAVVTYNTSHYILLFRSNLIRSLQARGYRVVAVAPTDAYSPRLREIDVEHVPISLDNKGVNPLRDAWLLVQLLAVYRRLRPDVILHFTVKPNIYGSLSARVLRIPVINNVTGLGTAFVRGGLLRALIESLYKLAFGRADVVFFQNSDDRALFLERKLVSQERTSVLPGSGVDTARFTPRPRATPGPFRFLFIGRVIRDKGIREYVEAADLLKREGIVFSAQVLGQLGARNPGAISEEQVQAWHASGAIDYLGEIDDVRPAIADADCIVLPSYREGTSKTLLEAASMGKPIVASDVPGCNNVVRDGRNGFLCQAKDANDLARAMRAMLQLPPGERERLGATGRQIMVSEFSEHLVLEKYGEAVTSIEDRSN